MDSFISLFSAGSPIKPILDHVCCKILFFEFSLSICACDSLWIIFFSPPVFFGQLCAIEGEGNGNPLQYSCRENPRDGGAWWVAIYGVAQSRIRLK